jgi:hypothetical protein
MRVQHWYSYSGDNWGGIIIPVKKGEVVTAEYTASGEVKYFRFIYAEGDNID